eukprot:jgi/Hompol1/2128/HPOL_005868-RA
MPQLGNAIFAQTIVQMEAEQSTSYPTVWEIVTDYDRLIYPTAVSVAINIAVYFLGVWSMPSLFPNGRRKAWLLTLLSSSTIVFGAIPLFVEFVALPHGATINDLPSLNSARANLLSTFFLGYLFADIIVGIPEYFSQIGLITGWVHHFGYLLVILNCMKYNITGGFLCFASILETPTIFLALGHINPAWRKDLVFGALFFLTRIVLHIYVILHVRHTYSSNFWMVTASPLPVHIFWFVNWVRQQLRIRKKNLMINQAAHASKQK